MKQSMLFAPTLKEVPRDAEVVSHQLMLRGGYIKQVAAGVYTYLPLATRVLKQIEDIVRDELNKLGCSELLMPALQPADLWIESGRWENYGSELFRLDDRKERKFALGPTHEEVITHVVRDYLNSYKKFPLAVYQIQTKFRDELRPRFGLMRGREFIMKDLYTFHTDREDMDKWYWEVAEAYKRIFKRCGLDVKIVESDTGQIGGDEAHEFMVVSEVGEDTIVYSNVSDFGANVEVSELKEGDPSPDGQGTIEIAKGIEVGNIFKLGTKYSEAMGAKFVDKDGKTHPAIMACYGIGISRVLMAVLEKHSDGNKVVWPSELTPFDVHVIPVNTKNEDQVNAANDLYAELLKRGKKVLLDDRNERAGVKFNDSDFIGAPLRITVGRDLSEGLVEVTDLNKDEKVKVALEEVLDFIKA
jgi:prolyl-tRNA synthetase